VSTGSAHGRVNLIGEHTDYNGGFVMPVAIPQRVRVELRPRDDRLVHVTSTEVDAGAVHEHEVGHERRTGTWADHVQGVTHVLSREGLLTRGFEARVSSDLPMGAGLGSSGALAVALLRALRDAFGIAIDDVTVARYAQRGEHEIVGARSGIMDQMAASLAREGEALFLDCRSLEFERIPLPDQVELIVVHSGVEHEHRTGAYNERRQQCEDAARALGVPQLRDVSAAELARVEQLPEPLRRRARHVVTEDDRVLNAIRALRDRDLDRLGALLDASHRSLRDDYEVSTPEVDLLVELVREQPGIRGARITGGGFGGSIVAIADAGSVQHAGATAVAEYEQRTGLDARILLPAPIP
jgi:galactokinase